MAFEVVKSMQADGLEWGEGYRPLGRQALATIIQGRMAEAVDCWLDSLDGVAMRDRRNGSYSRRLLSELGDIELSVPRTRRFCPTEVLKSYARRAPEIDRAILCGAVLGLSTRKVSASTVSRVAKTLDAAVAAFHARPLANRYKALMLDGVVLAVDRRRRLIPPESKRINVLPRRSASNLRAYQHPTTSSTRSPSSRGVVKRTKLTPTDRTKTIS